MVLEMAKMTSGGKYQEQSIINGNYFYSLYNQYFTGLRIKETKEVYEGEVTELTPCETENPMGGYGKTISHVIIGLKTAKGTKQLKVGGVLSLTHFSAS